MPGYEYNTIIPSLKFRTNLFPAIFGINLVKAPGVEVSLVFTKFTYSDIVSVTYFFVLFQM